MTQRNRISEQNVKCVTSVDSNKRRIFILKVQKQYCLVSVAYIEKHRQLVTLTLALFITSGSSVTIQTDRKALHKVLAYVSKTMVLSISSD